MTPFQLLLFFSFVMPRVDLFWVVLFSFTLLTQALFKSSFYKDLNGNWRALNKTRGKFFTTCLFKMGSQELAAA